MRFTVRVAGKPAPEVTWYREGTQIVSSPDFELIQEGDVHTLYIPEVFYEDSGKFSVKAANKAATTDCTAELIVEGNYYEINTSRVLLLPPPPLPTTTLWIYKLLYYGHI